MLANYCDKNILPWQMRTSSALILKSHITLLPQTLAHTHTRPWERTHPVSTSWFQIEAYQVNIFHPSAVRACTGSHRGGKPRLSIRAIFAV